MYTLDAPQLEALIKNQGFSSLGAFAKSIGVHRNTIHYYLSGKPIFSEKLEAIFMALDVKPKDIIVKKNGKTDLALEPMAPFIDHLRLKFPQLVWVLFGSRTRGTCKKYADWDMGAYCPNGLPHETYLKILNEKEIEEEQSPFFIDLVNLNNADDSFLVSISKDWMYLAGSRMGWIHLQKYLNQISQKR